MVKSFAQGRPDSDRTARVKSGDTAEPPPRFLRKWFPLLWFAIIAFVVFGQSIRYSYTYLDDQTLVLGSMDKLKSPSYLSNAFSEDVFHAPTGHGFYYRPILTISFMADALCGKGSFSMFHFSNIIYHILATFLLFLFFVGMGYDRIRSFLFGFLFLIHPMVTQAVAWVPGRNDTLLAICVFGSFVFWLKYLKSNRTADLMIHLLFYILALFTKENAIVLPLLIFLYSTLILRTPVKKHFLPGMEWLMIMLLWAIARHQALGGDNGVAFSTQVLSIVKGLPAVLPFLGKALFPIHLSVFPILADMKLSIILGIVVIGVFAFFFGMTRPKRWFTFFFGLLWFLAFLIPSFVSINNQIPNFSEHRSYLSIAGVLLMIMECNPVKNTSFSRMIPTSVLVGICLVFSVLTFVHTRHFKDQFSFWQNAVATSPSHAFNYNNLGAMYFMNEDLGKAEIYFRKALQINPAEPIANNNTGLVCMRTGRLAEAEKYYLEEIRINSSYDHAYFNLGLLYFNNGQPEEGIRLWEKTLTINPLYTDAYQALLFAYEKMHRQEDYERIAMKAKENGILP